MAYVPNELLSRLVGDRLVAVTFVLDSYLQLQFDEANMNVEVWPEVTFEGRAWNASDLGYADALRRLCSGTVGGHVGEDWRRPPNRLVGWRDSHQSDGG